MTHWRPAIAFIVPIAWAAIRLTGVAFAIAVAGTACIAGVRSYDASPDVGNWAVATSSDGKGCFLTREYDRPGATTLLLGLDVDGANRLTVLNDNWSIKPKDRLKLNFRLSNASFPGHFAIGIASAAKKGFVTSFGPKFPAIVATARDLQIFRGDMPVERLSLDGSGAAVTELRACVARQRGGPVIATGERQSPVSIPKDPFAVRPERKQKK